MKEYYLPPVIEKNAKKGYKPPDKGRMLASILIYLVDHGRKRGLLFRRPVEKVSRILLIHYPIDVFCIADKCILLDPVVGEPIYDTGLIAQLVFLLQHPSPTPFLEPSIVIEALNPIEFNEELIRDEYSIPPLKTGSARYYTPLIGVLYISPKGLRVDIMPPIYYLAEFPTRYRGIKAFDHLGKLVKRVPLDMEGLRDRLEMIDWILDRSDIRDSVQKGVDKLYGDGIISRKTRNYFMKEYIIRKKR